ncbi:beta/gamma crystallin domain-containing protein 2 [Rhinoderma darwinii]|uniref:beta/gamma crystallin domain-containing protein 2 n=1 Tax=Rhinoderma darwinii TaxID=43563 RepID=UPI003F663865
MSSPAPESPSSKKQGLRKRLLKFFSRSEGNVEEKPRTQSEGDNMSPTASDGGHLDRKGRSSWSEKWGRKDRHKPQEGAQSLPRLRYQKSDDAILRRTSRDSKARSLSYSELELPATNLLQRFGSLTWRKKRFSALEYSNTTPNVSTPTDSQWSVGRLERPAVGSELDLENKRPKSCIAEYAFSQLTPKNSNHCSKSDQKTLEVSTSFDCIADDGDNNSSQETTKGKIVKSRLPFAFPERLEGEEESLPCWAEGILKDYMSQDHHSPSSLLDPLSIDCPTLEIMGKLEEPDPYRSPLYHRILSKDLIPENYFIGESQVDANVFINKDVSQVRNPVISSICIETLKQNKEIEVEQTVSRKDSKIEDSEIITKHIPLYTSILSQDVAQMETGRECGSLSPEESQNNAPHFPEMSRFPTEYSSEKKTCNNQPSFPQTNNLLDGLQRKWTELQKPLALNEPFQDQIQNMQRQIIEHVPAQNSSVSSTISLATMKDDCKPPASPNTARIRYEVFITMTKEKKEQNLLPRLAQELVKAEELVGQDLRMSPSVEFQACGCHEAGLTEVTAQEISETPEQTEKTTPEEENSEKKRGGETAKGAQLDRSAVDEEFLFTTSGSDQVAESGLLHATKMEKPENRQRFFELAKSSNMKDNDSTKLSHGHVTPQLYVGHVKGLQKVFENISSKDDVICHEVTAKPQQYGSLREKHKVPQDVPVTPGVHGPVYSKVYNPLRKEHSEKRREHVTVTVIDSSEKSDFIRKSMKIKGSTKKYIANVELANKYHSDNEDKYRKAKLQLPDLKLSPRTPTPPPYKTINNVSISLTSPRGWKNDSVVFSPISSVAQRFENTRNNSSPMPSQTSGNFFFPGGSASHVKTSLETQQNLRKYDQNLIQPRDITKSHHTKISQESSKAELEPLTQANILHDVSYNVDEKEALPNRRFERYANTITNEIQKDSKANKNSGLEEMQDIFTDKQIAERMLMEDTDYQAISASNLLKSRGNKVYVEETMNTSTIDSELSHDKPPVITQRRKPPDYSHDVHQKLKNTLREKLGKSNDHNNHSSSCFKDKTSMTGSSVVTSNEKRHNIVGDLHKNKEVKSKYPPTIIPRKNVNKVNHDSIHLTKRTNKDEIKHYEASDSDQQLEEETKANTAKTKLTQKLEKLKNKQAEYECNIKNNLKPNTDTLYERQFTAIVNPANPLTDQSEGEVFIVSGKGMQTIGQKTDMMGPADNIEESKTDVSGRAVGEINTATTIEDVIESYLQQPEMDIPEDKNGFVLNKPVNKKEEDKPKQKKALAMGNGSHEESKGLIDLMQHGTDSITTIGGQMESLNEIDEWNRVKRTMVTIDILEQPEREVLELTDQPVNDVKQRSSAEKCEQNLKSSDLFPTDILDQAFHMDSNLNTIGRDIMDCAQSGAVSVETEGKQVENVYNTCENSTVMKKALNVIQKTEEVDLNTVDMKDQTILDAAVAQDEPVANDLTVNIKEEQSKDLIKNAEYNKDQAVEEIIFPVDSPVEIGEQPCNNLKEDPDNMSNTVVNTSHLSDTHVLYQNTAQIGDAILDQHIQNTDIIGEHHENIKKLENVGQALYVIDGFVDNNVIENPIVVSEDDFGTCSDEDKIIKQPVSESVDHICELVLDEAEQTGNHPSAGEGSAANNGNSTVAHKLDHLVEDEQGTLSHPDDPQNIPDKLLLENSILMGEDKENYSLDKISKNEESIIFAKEVIKESLEDVLIKQVEIMDIMQHNKCLIDETEDSMYDKEVSLHPDLKTGKLTLDISHEIQDAGVKLPNDILKGTDIKESTDDQPSGNTQMSKDIANQITDKVCQIRSLVDNPPSKGENVNMSPTVILHSSDMQTTYQLPKADANEFEEKDTSDFNVHMSPNRLDRDISSISLSDVEKKITADGTNMSSSNPIYSQVKQISEEQTTEIVQYSHLFNSEKNINEASMMEHATNSAKEEETESSENMEIWVSKLRKLETPECMKYLREPRQPRSSPLTMYATLPPIKEDQGSPKSDLFDFRLPVPDIKEKKILPEESESTVDPKVAEQTEKSEQGEKTYSWERNTERSPVRSSPLELMRKHSGDELSRSDSYKAFIAQNLSQRQSSIIGSLLLSEKSDKKTDGSEGKSYSRLESSFLLSSYMKPQKDKLGETEETQTSSENATCENDTTTTTTNDTLPTTTEDPKQKDKVDSSIPQVVHVEDNDSTELPSKLNTSVSSPLKVFPDVWLHPEKSHGKLNPRPGKIILFSAPDFRGHSYEIYSDVGMTCDWELQGTISVRIIRGGWLLYEKSHFRGKRVMLSEGDTDLTCPWEVEDKLTKNLQDNTKQPKCWIGSLRHVVRDFHVPRISLFMDENGEGNKITILGATPDSSVNGQPTKTESIIVHSGLWLVYSRPFFEGDPYILEPGGYPNRKAWNGHDLHLCSLQPARIGGPSVEKPNEPKVLLFQHAEFKGHSWEVTRDLHSLEGEPNKQGERLTSVGSLKVLGGCWVAYEKEGFHGQQYLLEEGDYQKWSQWGGCTEEVGSLRHIRTNFSEPEIILYEKPGCIEGACLRLNEALADIEVAQYGTNTGSIQVLNGVWVAYENVDFSGEQYILEKGIYHNYHDWGAKDSRICSVQPVLQVGGQSLQYLPKVQLFSESNFHGDYIMHTEDRVLLPKTISPQSCRIEGGSWILYEGEDCCGEQYILVEGDYPTRTAMGCQTLSIIRSLKKVPLYFSIPSISLHGLERFEGKELEFTGAVRSLQGEGYNNHVLSVKVASGIWVLYEHSDFRGRQWILEQTQITNWLLYSGIQRIGSLCPIRQRRVYFRLRNRAIGLFLCVPEPADNMKAARVQVTEQKDGSCDLWYYEEGRIKNQMTPQMSLQVVGMTASGTKVVMWSEGRKPIQTWSLEDSGLIMSCLFEGLCLDMKGGHSYDSDHVVVWETAEDRLTQRWDLVVF